MKVPARRLVPRRRRRAPMPDRLRFWRATILIMLLANFLCLFTHSGGLGLLTYHWFLSG